MPKHCLKYILVDGTIQEFDLCVGTVLAVL